MKRRTVLKVLPTIPLAAAGLSGGSSEASTVDPKTIAPSMRGYQDDNKKSGYGKEDLKEFADVGYSDMSNTDADGNTKPGFSHRSSKPKKDDPKALYQMPLTKEEQDIMDGKKGPELAKVMKIVVAHGNAFNAEKLVDLGGAPHSSLFTGQDYLKPAIKMFMECADAGIKAYAPYTVNPRCYDVYNVENNANSRN
jgi:hypothetical protein